MRSKNVVSRNLQSILPNRTCIAGSLLILLVLLSGCAPSGKDALRVAGGRFVERVLQKEEIPTQFEADRTFFYGTNHVRPDSLLTALQSAGFSVSKAWYCEDMYYYCMDQFGPHFTIELKRDDPRILQYNFTRGDGRVSCAHQVSLFVPAD